MLLLVGLGNPNPNNTNNRHNVGFFVIDQINKKFKLSKQKPKFKGLLTTGEIGEQKVYAIKPLTFMNSSGVCVKELIEYRRDPTVDLKAKVEEYQSIAKDVDETLSEDYFPFTDEAVSAIAPYIQTLTDPKRELYPGSIMEALNSIVDLGYAADPGTKIFTKAKIPKLAEL